MASELPKHNVLDLRRNKELFNGGEPAWCYKREAPMQVLCLGMPRTGTTSLTAAMEILGYGDLYSVREAWRRNHTEFWMHAMKAKYGEGGRPFQIEQLESVLGDHQGAIDVLASFFAEELIAAYPKARVILTVRSVDSWYNSVFRTMWYNHTRLFTKFCYVFHHSFGKMAREYWRLGYWNDFEANGRRVYHEHNALIKRITPPERLLVYEVKEGWEPLCQFLGKEIPPVEFPRTNDQEEHRTIMNGGRQAAVREVLRGWALKYSPLVVAVVIAWWLRRGIWARVYMFVKRYVL